MKQQRVKNKISLSEEYPESKDSSGGKIDIVNSQVGSTVVGTQFLHFFVHILNNSDMRVADC